MGILTPVLSGIMYIFDLFKFWLSIFFVIPLQNLEILWILVPIWVNLIFTDFFQEKRGTSLGNAVTNGAVMLWVSIDWVRFLIRSINGNELAFSWNLFFKFSLCGIVVISGLMIIIHGIKGKRIISFIGRVRETSYIMLVLSPVVYGITELTWRYVGVIALFFPLFYGVFAFIDRVLPHPKTYKISDDMLEERKTGAEKKSDVSFTDLDIGPENVGGKLGKT